MKDLNQYIDHTLLKAAATAKDILQLCEEAKRFAFYSVCINPCYIEYAKSLLTDSQVKVCTVIGFPLGATTMEQKIFETSESLKLGANEIDMVINIGFLKDQKLDLVSKEILQIANLCHKNNAVLKVIIETPYLTDAEKVIASKMVKDNNGDFVKTSTGLTGLPGAVENDIKLIRTAVGEKLGIKAAGGIKTKEQALELIECGATRIGASSSVSFFVSE